MYIRCSNNYGFNDWNNAFLTLGELRNEMARAFFDLDNEFAFGRKKRNARGDASFTDEGDAFVVKAAIPGLEEKDLEITLEGKSLTISGKRENPVPDGYTALRKERPAYNFSKSYNLPSDVDSENVQATLKDGVLNLHMPKVPEAKPVRISVAGN